MKTLVTGVLCFFLTHLVLAQNSVATDSSVNSLFSALKSEADAKRKEELGSAIERAYVKNVGERRNAELLEYSRQMVAIAFAESGDVSRSKRWIGKIEKKSIKEATVIAVANEFADKHKFDDAEKLIKPLYELSKSKVSSSAETENSLDPQPRAGDIAYHYGVILYKKGDYKKAIALLAPNNANQSIRKYASPEAYAISLAKSGNYKESYEEFYRMILTPGHRSELFNEVGRDVFIKKLGSARRFEELTDSMNTVQHKRLESKVKAMAISEPAPDFELTDLNGRSVSLRSLRGKTVILDFWATWCQPCIASFPGMQKAVDFYRNDTSVVFLFIHTSEHSQRPIDDVRRFMKYKKYSFDVYMDLRNKETGTSPVAANFKVRGIPAKFVIDGNGVIRFKNAGYVSEHEAVPEIKMMVDASRL